MSLHPRARVTYTPTHGPARRAQVIVKVNDVGAYLVRTSAGARLTVPGSQLHPTETEARNAGLER